MSRTLCIKVYGALYFQDIVCMIVEWRHLVENNEHLSSYSMAIVRNLAWQLSIHLLFAEYWTHPLNSLQKTLQMAVQEHSVLPNLQGLPFPEFFGENHGSNKSTVHCVQSTHVKHQQLWRINSDLRQKYHWCKSELIHACGSGPERQIKSGGCSWFWMLPSHLLSQFLPPPHSDMSQSSHSLPTHSLPPLLPYWDQGL